MNAHHSSMQRLCKATVSGLLAALLVVGCGGEKPEAMLASAKEYLAKREPNAATIQLKNALQQNPELAEARFLLGKALLESGDPTGAELELRKAQNYKHPADEVTPLLARTLLVLGQGDKVIDELGKVEVSTPLAKADLQTSLAQAYQMQDKRELAAAAYAAALLAQPGYAPALMGQAGMKTRQDDIPAAMALLDEATEKSPDLYQAWQFKGDLLTTKGDLPGALQAYRKALELKADYLPAHAAIIKVLMGQGKLDEVGQQLAAMNKIAPGHPQTTYLQALLAYQQKVR